MIVDKFKKRIERRRQIDRLISEAEQRGIAWLGDKKGWHKIFKSWVYGPVVAMRKTVVFGCVRLLTNTNSSLPLNVLMRLEEGGSRVATEHPLQKILHEQPNAAMTTVEYNQFVNRMILEKGNCFVYKVYERGIIKELIPLVGAMEIRFKDEPGQVSGRNFVYRYHPNKGGAIEFEPWEVMHFRYMSRDGIIGLSPIEAAKDIIDNEAKLQDFSTKYFENGANIGAIISMLTPDGANNQGLNDSETRNKYQEAIDDAWVGNDNSHKAVIVPYDLKVEKVVTNPSESQALESRTFSAKYIAGVVFGVPGFKFNLSDPKYNNAIEGNTDFIKDTITPLLVLQEKRMNLDLLSEADREAGYFIKYNMDALLRGDAKSRAEVYEILVKKTGIMTQNEARNKEDLPSLPGGDTIWVQMQDVPRESQLKLFEQNMQMNQGRRLKDFDQDVLAEVRGYLGYQIRQTSGQLVRNRTRDQWSPTYNDVAQKNVVYETLNLNKQIKKLSEAESDEEFRAWMDEFYPKLAEKLEASFNNPVMGYADAIQLAALAEAGKDEIESEQQFDAFVQSYVAGIAARWVDSSRGQLISILEDEEVENTAEALQQRSDEWHETRAEKVTKREIVTGDNAFTLATWVLVGVSRKKWITQGDPCPFCAPMHGRTVAITQNFVQKGTTLVDPDGKQADMVVTRETKHPQLHNG